MAKNESPFHAELERRSQDILRVFNPTDKRIVVKWDIGSGVPKVFPVEAAKDGVPGEGLFPRYIAEKYIRERVSAEIRLGALKAVEDENKRRNKTGQKLLDKTVTGDQLEFESPHYNMNTERWLSIAKKYYGGVVTEFGLDNVVEEEAAVEPEYDRPVHQAGMEALYEQNPESPRPAQSTKSVADKKKEAVKGAKDK